MVHFSKLNDILRKTKGTWKWRFGRWFAFSILFQQVIFRLTTKAKNLFRVRKDMCTPGLADLRPHPFFSGTCPFCKGKGKMPVLGIADPSLSSLNCKHLERRTSNVKHHEPLAPETTWMAWRSIKGMWEAPFQESNYHHPRALHLATYWHLLHHVHPKPHHATPLSAWFQLILIGWQCGNQTSVDLKKKYKSQQWEVVWCLGGWNSWKLIILYHHMTVRSSLRAQLKRC